LQHQLGSAGAAGELKSGSGSSSSKPLRINVTGTLVAVSQASLPDPADGDLCGVLHAQERETCDCKSGKQQKRQSRSGGGDGESKGERKKHARMHAL
jgi:hypothetical protein